MEAKRISDGRWEAFTDNGREKTGLDVLEWIAKAERLGAGEILLTSIDNEGTALGFDFDLIGAVSRAVKIPVIASGGMGSTDHLCTALNMGADAVAMANVLHYRKLSVGDMRLGVASAGVDMCVH